MPLMLFIGPILWGHSGTLCHALSLLLLWTSVLHCHSPGVATVARRLRYSYSWLRFILVVVSTVATPDEWQCKIRKGGVRRLAVVNGPNIFQMLLVLRKGTVSGVDYGDTNDADSSCLSAINQSRVVHSHSCCASYTTATVRR